MLSEVRGQDEAVHALRQVVEGRRTSPLLLVGDEGLGRRFACMQTAFEVFCTGTKTADCRCDQCTQLRCGAHSDLTLVCPDGDKDIGVDAVREFIATTSVYPTQSPVRIAILDGVDRLSMPAANALLKTIEEPHSKTRFFLLSETLTNVIPTIRSRCGQVYFRALPEAFVVSEVSRSEKDPTKALVYTRMSGGSLGRALKMSLSGRISLRNKVFSWMDLGSQRNLPALFSAIDAVERELPLALVFLEQILHDLTMIQFDPARIVNVDRIEEIRMLRNKCGQASIVTLRGQIRELTERLRRVRLNSTFQVKTIFATTFVGS